jgi:hydroxymethylglutaryl-CoA reductase
VTQYSSNDADVSRDDATSRFPGFYKLPVDERIDALAKYICLTAEDQYELKREPLQLSVADTMIENVIGVFGVPLGAAVNFRINDRDVVVPMAVEEASVVAAASHVAKLVREHGALTAEADDSVMIGQIQLLNLDDPEAARAKIQEARERLLKMANEQDPILCDLGGGAKDIEVRLLDTPQGPMIIIHLYVDVRDAMGANAVNTMTEALAPYIEGITGGKVFLRILSNLADRRCARATIEIAPEAFSEHDWNGIDVVGGIQNAYAFAYADPYRAATHNKGIMNGIDAVMLATGNDWRAIEAGAHAYAARDGQYRPLSTWERLEDGRLRGTIELPMAVGIIGGTTKVHPMAKLALKILRVESARELAEIAAAVGLVQNLAALRSLVTEGIQKGHMILHARNVAVSAGAVGEAVSHVANQMIREGRIRFDRATHILKHVVRGAKGRVHDIEQRIRHPRDDEKKE